MQSPLAVLPNTAILIPGNKDCQDLGTSGAVLAGKNGQGLAARAQQAYSTIQSSPAAAAAAAGAKKILDKVNQMLAAGQYGQAQGYTREIERVAVQAVRNPNSITAVESALPTSGRVPDMFLTLNGTSARVLADVKFWRLSTLLKQGPQSPAVKMSNQVTGFLSENATDQVYLEFVQTKTSPITNAQDVLNVLSQNGADISRVGVRIVQSITDPAISTFNTGVIP